jgi:phosphotransferase system HPr-like phosphotransfer protein
MGLANYRIFGAPGDWHVEHDGKSENTYVTKEAAFEAAVAAASLALRQGHQIIVTAPGSDGAAATTGSRETRDE